MRMLLLTTFHLWEKRTKNQGAADATIVHTATDSEQGVAGRRKLLVWHGRGTCITSLMRSLCCGLA